MDDTRDRIYSQREEEFAQGWCGHEGDDIKKLTIVTAKRLDALCLFSPAFDEAMKVLYRGIFGEIPPDKLTQPWLTLWQDIDEGNFDVIPLGDKTTCIHAYAYYGLSPKLRRDPCSIDDIRAAIDLVTRAVAPSVEPPDTPELDRTLLAAEGRLALDRDLPITLEQLAALAGIGMKSMRNAAAHKSSGSGLQVIDGAATPGSALRWLTARGDFRSSVWKLAGATAGDEEMDGSVVEKQPELEGEIFWVPFASDETEFHPQTCLRGGGYTIGPKGAEQKIDDYREALRHLARMRPAAYWRRPNLHGNWGIVTANGFRPRTAADLGLDASGGDK